MAYLKPQTPLKDLNSGDYFYPLTTIDLIITGTSRLSAFLNESNNLLNLTNIGNINIKGTLYFASGTTYYINNSADAKLNKIYGSLASNYVTFKVDGDENTYYPVIFSAQTDYYPALLFNITRNYSETAPDTWNTATHRGGLTLTLLWNNSRYWDGNGAGQGDSIEIIRFLETYCSMVAKIGNSTAGLVVWLRGGGANYHVFSQAGIHLSVSIKLTSYTDSAKLVFDPITAVDNNNLNSYRRFLSGTANRIAYFYDSNTINSGSITTDGGYLGNISYLSVNEAHLTSYRFLVNGTSYFKDNILIESGKAILFKASEGGTATSTPTALTYGRLLAYGTLAINADTDNSETEYVILTAGHGMSNSISDGFYVGYSEVGSYLTTHLRAHVGVNGVASSDYALYVNGTSYFNGNATFNGNISFTNSGTGFRGINYGTMGDNDLWRIGGAATGSNAGYMEIATADDGNEPIYVRLYTGVFSTLQRTLTLLDASGNSSFPGTITALSKGSSWLAGQNGADRPAFNLNNATDTGSYWPWMRLTNTGSSKYFSFGILGNSFYWIGSATSRTDNGYDHGMRFDVSNGLLELELGFFTSNLRVGTYRTGYALNAASFICDDWIRTVGNTGWYNETYGGGWYMQDSDWIRNWGYKSVYINALCRVDNDFLVATGNCWGSIWCGTRNDTGHGEHQIGVLGGAGWLYMYCLPDSNGNKGLYGGNSSGNGASYIWIGSNNDMGAGVRFYGAVWNDYAEFRKGKMNKMKPGQVVTETGNGTMILATQKLLRGCKFLSDTYGFALGRTKEYLLPIAVAGRALVYCDTPKEDLLPGDCVCANYTGNCIKMTKEEIIQNPDAIIGTVSEIPSYTIWHAGDYENENGLKQDVVVDGRIWVYVR